MKIFVIGGTGLVGSYLLPRLIAQEHTVCALTRSAVKLVKLNQLGAFGILGDIRKPGTIPAALPERPDIIVLLAMPQVKPGSRMTSKRKAELKRETNDFFRNAMDMAVQFDIPVILPSGTSFRTVNNQVADETWPILRVGLTEIGADTDDMVARAIKTGQPKVIQLLFGKIYGNGGLFLFMYRMMEKGHSRVIGRGDNFIPNVHADDAASAIIKAIEKQPVGEKFIIADDTPVSQKDFTTYMAELMHQKKPGHIPGWIIRCLLGKDFYAIIRMNCVVSNAKAKDLLDWKPAYPSYREGLAATLAEIKKSKNYFDL
jgi:nucleoside-diphosphate-sugar epimerase